MKNCVVASLIMIIGFSIISYGANEKASFEDVNETAWYYPEVQYVVNEGLMNGVSEDKFDPNIPVTREMITTALSLTASYTMTPLNYMKTGSDIYNEVRHYAIRYVIIIMV